MKNAAPVSILAGLLALSPGSMAIAQSDSPRPTTIETSWRDAAEATAHTVVREDHEAGRFQMELEAAKKDHLIGTGMFFGGMGLAAWGTVLALTATEQVERYRTDPMCLIDVWACADGGFYTVYLEESTSSFKLWGGVAMMGGGAALMYLGHKRNRNASEEIERLEQQGGDGRNLALVPSRRGTGLSLVYFF